MKIGHPIFPVTLIFVINSGAEGSSTCGLCPLSSNITNSACRQSIKFFKPSISFYFQPKKYFSKLPGYIGNDFSFKDFLPP